MYFGDRVKAQLVLYKQLLSGSSSMGQFMVTVLHMYGSRCAMFAFLQQPLWDCAQRARGAMHKQYCKHAWLDRRRVHVLGGICMLFGLRQDRRMCIYCNHRGAHVVDAPARPAVLSITGGTDVTKHARHSFDDGAMRNFSVQQMSFDMHCCCC